MLLKIPQGAVFADAKRGQIFLINGNQAKDLTGFGSGMNRWFTVHLAFEILKYFPDINVDNNFNGIGLHGVYDASYERIIITKLDYIPLYDTISYDEVENKFYNTTDIKREVFLSDQEFFCNKSYTISYNFNTESWISFHSYLPNWYVGETRYFYSGLNYCPNDFDALVGTMLPNFTTTTTSTTRYIVPTTTTTTTAYVPDCEIVVEVTIPACDIDGNAVIIYTPEVCQRPPDLQQIVLVSGYTLNTPVTSVDSTVDYVTACTNLTYFATFFEDGNYEAVQIIVETVDWLIGKSVYVPNGTTDCTCIPDGWYFTPDAANGVTGFDERDYVVMRVENCVIVEEYVCDGGTTTSTTTTTTTLVSAPYCYTGVYADPDPVHPLGGVITYVDPYGNTITQSGIWDDDTVVIVASSIITRTGLAPCPVVNGGVSNGVATVTGTLNAVGALAGTSNGSSTTTGTLTGSGALIGDSNGAATSDGTLTGSGALSGESNGAATVDGTL